MRKLSCMAGDGALSPGSGRQDSPWGSCVHGSRENQPGGTLRRRFRLTAEPEGGPGAGEPLRPVDTRALLLGSRHRLPQSSRRSPWAFGFSGTSSLLSRSWAQPRGGQAD